MIPRRGFVATIAVAVKLVASPASVDAQLDPLLFLKSTKPNVIIAFDTRADMLRDSHGAYYDGFTYSRTGAEWESLLGLGTQMASGAHYRRRFNDLRRVDGSPTGRCSRHSQSRLWARRRRRTRRSGAARVSRWRASHCAPPSTPIGTSFDSA